MDWQQQRGDLGTSFGYFKVVGGPMQERVSWACCIPQKQNVAENLHEVF